MPIYIDLPETHERILHELAAEEMRPYRQQAAYMLCLAIEHAAKVRERDRDKALQAVLEVEHEGE